MSLHKFYNPNPARNRVGDCTVRAICRATGDPWDKTFAGLAAFAFSFKDMPSANLVWGAYLRDKGFTRHIVDDHGLDLYTAEVFNRDHPEGIYILAIDGHVVCAVDGFYYDSWDSGQEIPVYYWTRGD